MGYRGGRGGGGRHWQQDLRVPQGWEDCPTYGRPIATVGNHTFKVIASKVPLHAGYNQQLRRLSNSYTLRHAVEAAEHEYSIRIGMVLDLTNSNRYYDFRQEFPEYNAREVVYVKVPCRGRGESPEPASVNHAVWEMYCFWTHSPDHYIFVHCTHGFNRTGYVVACAMTRLAAAQGMTINRAVRRFADARPPGIYKDAYINDLFRYHHEARPRTIVTPAVPAWKGVGDEEDEEDAGNHGMPGLPEEVRHDIIEQIGEPIVEAEREFIQGMVYHHITGQDIQQQGRRPHFPGSQPVSLTRENLGLLQHQRYFVSWKADGTRYLMLLTNTGCYLIDRSFKVVRLQMRFPTQLLKPSVEYPVGMPHTCTVLDGEMVVDDVEGRKVRRYLIYDIACLGSPVTQMIWEERFKLIDKAVVGPRNKERDYILGRLPPKEKYKSPPLEYDYQSEAFSVRKKDFWPLYAARKLIHELIPNLCHEADGLILQSCQSGYVANTDNALLKFKFAHLNSVDFKLSASRGPNGPQFRLALMDTTKGRRGPHGPPLVDIPTPVTFPEGVDGATLDGAIIECAWDGPQQCWKYMRVRQDKDKPNAYFVYEKVLVSIKDDIREKELLEYLDQVFFNCAPYERDVASMPPDKKPAHLPPPPPSFSNHTTRAGRDQGGYQQQQEEDDAEQHLQQQQQAHDAEEKYVPWSPPYWGPEPTPPRDPGVPLDPHTWLAHDPATYPQQYLNQLPPPPPLLDGAADQVHNRQAGADDADGAHSQQRRGSTGAHQELPPPPPPPPPPQADGSLGSAADQQGAAAGGYQMPPKGNTPPDGYTNPYYTYPDGDGGFGGDGIQGPHAQQQHHHTANGHHGNGHSAQEGSGDAAAGAGAASQHGGVAAAVQAPASAAAARKGKRARQQAGDGGGAKKAAKYDEFDDL